MAAETYLKMLREIRDVAFATVDEHLHPQVRIIDVMLVEGHSLYFCTARGKDFYRQLMRDSQTAITGMNRNYQMIRLNGRAARLFDQKQWIDRIFAENPSMNEVYPGESRYILEVFCIDSGQISFFDLSSTPIVRQTVSFGNSKPEWKGFEITDRCIGCGQCKTSCPQQCIQDGTPYQICQEHCLHCGLCYEVCPVNSIIMKGKPNE